MGSVRIANGETGALVFDLGDNNPTALNPMAKGSTVSVLASNGLTAAVTGGTPVPNTLAPNTVVVTYRIDKAITNSGVLTLTFTSPKGVSTAVTQSVAVSAPLGAVPCP